MQEIPEGSDILFLTNAAFAAETGYFTALF